MGFCFLYAAVSKVTGRGYYATYIYFSLVSFTLTFGVMGGILGYQCYTNWEMMPMIYDKLYDLIFGSKEKVLLLTYWLFFTIIGIISFYGLTHKLKLGMISSRKLFHVLALVLFLPGFIYSVNIAYNIYSLT
jgi:hypothetical protein